jgi:hypothetical protein
MLASCGPTSILDTIIPKVIFFFLIINAMIKQNIFFFYKKGPKHYSIVIIKLKLDVNSVSELGHWVNVSTNGSSVKHN